MKQRGNDLAFFEFVFVVFGLGQLSLAGIAILAEDRQKDVCVRSGATHVTSDNVHRVLLRYKTTTHGLQPRVHRTKLNIFQIRNSGHVRERATPVAHKDVFRGAEGHAPNGAMATDNES